MLFRLAPSFLSGRSCPYPCVRHARRLILRTVPLAGAMEDAPINILDFWTTEKSLSDIKLSL